MNEIKENVMIQLMAILKEDSAHCLYRWKDVETSVCGLIWRTLREIEVTLLSIENLFINIKWLDPFHKYLVFE